MLLRHRFKPQRCWEGKAGIEFLAIMVKLYVVSDLWQTVMFSPKSLSALILNWFHCDQESTPKRSRSWSGWSRTRWWRTRATTTSPSLSPSETRPGDAHFPGNGFGDIKKFNAIKVKSLSSLFFKDCSGRVVSLGSYGFCLFPLTTSALDHSATVPHP